MLSITPETKFHECIHPLIEGLEEYSQHERDVIKARYIPILHATETEATRAEYWDTTMFLVGFVGSLLMTFATAIAYTGYLQNTAAIGFVMLVISSLGTAAQAVRERLKFRESARVLRRMLTKLQRTGVLFVARTGPYATTNRGAAFQRFVVDVETLKSLADQQRLKLREPEDEETSAAGRNPVQPTRVISVDVQP